jgi:hypothetical protein
MHGCRTGSLIKYENLTTQRNTTSCSHTDGAIVRHTVHRPGDDPRKECEECGIARGSNVRYYPT